MQRYTDISVFTISFMYNNNLGMKKIKNRGVKFKTLTKFIYLFKLKQWYRHRRRKPPSSDFRHIVKASAQSCHTDCPTHILYFILHIYNTFITLQYTFYSDTSYIYSFLLLYLFTASSDKYHHGEYAVTPDEEPIKTYIQQS